MRLSEGFVRHLDTKAKYVVALLWIGVLVVSGLFGIDFFGETSDEDDSLPHSTLAYNATAALNTLPGGNMDYVVLMLGNKEQNLTDADLHTFYEQLYSLAQAAGSPSYAFVFHTLSSTYMFERGEWCEYDSPKPHFRSDDGKRVMALASVGGYYETIRTVKLLRDAAKDLLPLLPAGTRVWCSGDDIIWDIILGALENDLIVGDSISIPTALVVLCLTLRSSRYILVPLLSIATCILLSFLAMRPVAHATSVSSVAPNLMMSLSIAMSVDYALFIFSRFREEMRRGISVHDACVNVLRTAGGTIFVSGFTFIACALTLLFVPVKLLSSMGIAAAVTVASAVVVNLTLVPTIILIFPSFFREATTNRGICSLKSSSSQAKSGGQKAAAFGGGDNGGGNGNNIGDHNNDQDHDDDDDDILLLVEDEKLPLTPDNNGRDVTVDAMAARARKSPWYRFGRRITRHAWLCIIIISALAGAAFYPALTFKHVSGVDCECPQNRRVVKDFHSIANTFGAGTILPFVLIFQTPNTSVILTESHFKTVYTACSRLASALPHLHIEDFDGLAIDHGNRVNLERDVLPCLVPNGTELRACDRSIIPGECMRPCFYYGYYTSLTPDTAFDMVWLRAHVDGSSAAGQGWTHKARAELETLQEEFNMPLLLARGGVQDVDMIAHVFNRFHVAIASVCVVVFVLMLFSFRSLTIAIKAVVSIALTQGLVYGIGTCVYEYGILNFLGWKSVAATGGLCWIPSILAFTILVGLGLDYHIFLLSRVVEFRRLGFDDEESVLLGLACTGRVITAAGVIMAIAFLGLLFSHEALVQQLAFFVVIAVLIDTFVVRACLVPTMMSVLGAFNWWPLSMPKVTRSAHLEPGTFGYGPIVGRLSFANPEGSSSTA